MSKFKVGDFVTPSVKVDNNGHFKPGEIYAVTAIKYDDYVDLDRKIVMKNGSRGAQTGWSADRFALVSVNQTLHFLKQAVDAARKAGYDVSCSYVETVTKTINL